MSRRGLTLIELVVVLAIFASLAATLLPVLFTARANARQALCANNLYQIRTAMQLYYTTSHYLPMDSLEPGGTALADVQTNSLWTGAYRARRGLGLLATEYLEEPEVFFEREANWAMMVAPNGWKRPNGTVNWEHPGANVLSSYLYRQNFANRAEKENAGTSHALVTEYTLLDGHRYNHGGRGAHVLYADGSVSWTPFNPDGTEMLHHDWYSLQAVALDTGLTGWETWLDSPRGH